jgi:dephospho-CoA kinase
MTSKVFCVGLTGGIGSGKSTVADRFAKLGAAIIDTDVISHQLTGPDGRAMREIIACFGSEITNSTGAMDRAAMRGRVFSDSDARRKLEAILHPMIRAESVLRLQAVTAPYALLVVPLLVENLASYQHLLNRIAVVDCEESQQLARISSRPGISLEQAKSILAVQANQASRLQIADDLIENRGDLVGLDHQIQRLHQKYLTLAAASTCER